MPTTIILVGMRNAATDTEAMGADEMFGALDADLAELVAAGELDAAEAREMLEWLGSPLG